ncbi:hypothetical protein KPSA3_00945 [Pseudomonas syringae pv. actinidiae]|uniref:Uncharacterized protein n=1 Tax=Pseudomonas syringae pv. actinidiae TaxID=103796 RepID=A0AAN4Q0U2_PSESF|nr:hypothetical protein KPSA3_00945 [Pseudomonas syringae pv. actinidiae]
MLLCKVNKRIGQRLIKHTFDVTAFVGRRRGARLIGGQAEHDGFSGHAFDPVVQVPLVLLQGPLGMLKADEVGIG